MISDTGITPVQRMWSHDEDVASSTWSSFCVSQTHWRSLAEKKMRQGSLIPAWKERLRFPILREGGWVHKRHFPGPFMLDRRRPFSVFWLSMRYLVSCVVCFLHAQPIYDWRCSQENSQHVTPSVLDISSHSRSASLLPRSSAIGIWFKIAKLNITGMRELPLFKKKLMPIDLHSLPTRKRILNHSEETMVSLEKPLPRT